MVISLVVAALLLAFLWRAGAARATTVWLLAAGLPLLAAMSAAFSGQARAERVLAQAPAQFYGVSIRTGGQRYQVRLSLTDAACLARSLRTRAEYDLQTPSGDIPLRADTEVSGQLPAEEVVQALSIRGADNCAHFRKVKAE